MRPCTQTHMFLAVSQTSLAPHQSDVRQQRDVPQDFFRKSITPEYTDIQRVDRDRVRGIVEFATREDLKRAIRDLDGAQRLVYIWSPAAGP